MDIGSQILSDAVVFTKYATYVPELNRRETWEEIVTRNKQMHINKFPQLTEMIEDAYKLVYDKRVLPSMRSAQFAGEAARKSNVRLYNCAYLPIDSHRAFDEILYLLLCGTGVGYSVRQSDISQLPTVKSLEEGRFNTYTVPDSIEGWATAVRVLIESYFFGHRDVVFDYNEIRPMGSRLTSGGIAPGPVPLMRAMIAVKRILQSVTPDSRLSSLQVHDIVCHLSDCVLAGGIRRSALLTLFDNNDKEMLTCKFWENIKDNPQRYRANNSVSIDREQVSYADFCSLWSTIKNSNAGEPGIFWTSSGSFGTNPCQPAFAPINTVNGLRRFGDVVVGDLVWTETGWATVVNKWSTGIKPVYKYSTNSGVFYGTENHRVVQNGEKIAVSDAENIDTLAGNSGLSIGQHCCQDVMDGLVMGDGSKHTASNNLMLLNIGKDDTSYLSSEVAHLIGRERPGIGPYVWEISTTITPDELPSTPTRSIPDRFYYGNARKAASFLRGLYSANGSVVAQGSRITFKTVSPVLREQVQVLLSSIGIRSYYTTNKSKVVAFANGAYTCKESYDVNITSDREIFVRLIGFLQPYKNAKVVIPTGSGKGAKITYSINSKEYMGDMEVFDMTVDNEPHTYWTGGCNVSNCAEIALRPYSFCNLCEVNVSNVESQEDYMNRVWAATVIGTLQASYTDFPYLRPIWRKTTEKDALLGIGMTGIASGSVLDLDMVSAAQYSKETNEVLAEYIGINPAARITTVKPSGTSSIVLGCSSGVHAWHDKYYIRRIQLINNEPLARYIIDNHPELYAVSKEKPDTQIVVEVPIKAPDDAITRHESPLDLLERVKLIASTWIATGHVSGENKNNVSCTVSIKPDEWDTVRDWMYENREHYTGLSCFPYWDGIYEQAPFETITEEEYYTRVSALKDFDITRILEYEDNTVLEESLACAGGSCTLTSL